MIRTIASYTATSYISILMLLDLTAVSERYYWNCS